MKKVFRSGVFYFVLLIAILLLVVSIFDKPKVDQPKYSTFISWVEKGDVKEATLFRQRGSIEGKLKNSKEFTLSYSPFDNELEKLLMEKKVKFTYDNTEGVD